ncbi:MAG TPA: hypothetical protein DCY13_21505 [Verrucomicrobiales bacterium]|nr:hypothetical protein [Verrucomicrobiales bacterium]
MIEQAIQWIRRHTVPGGGIVEHARASNCDLLLTGRCIPTLLAAGELTLARQYADRLLGSQRTDGSLPTAAGGTAEGLVVAAAIEGWLALIESRPELEPALRRAGDWLVQSLASTPPTSPMELHSLAALRRLGRRLNEPRYTEPALSRLARLKNSVRLASFEKSGLFVHEYCALQQALLELGETRSASDGMAELARLQAESGALPGGFDAPWLCVPGQFLAATVWFQLGERERAERALAYGEKFRNPSGGFFGSHGVAAAFLPASESSLAVQLHLDACRLRDGQGTKTTPCAGAQAHETRNPVSASPSSGSTGTSAGAARPLEAEEWHEAITAGATPAEIAARVRRGQVPEWVQPILEASRPDDVILEQGSGTGAMSAWLALQGRKVVLLDYSQPCLDFALEVFRELGLEAPAVCRADLRQQLPLPDASVDHVWSSGVLEHFSDDEIVHILSESKRVARRQVLSLVPNARSLAYRLGKWDQEKGGRWKYGYEDPKFTLAHLFARAGLTETREFTVGARHSLNFLDTTELAPARNLLGRFLKELPPAQSEQLAQGYLLGTVGWVKPPRRLAVVPSDPLEAYEKKGNGSLLRRYFNPAGYFDEVYCLSPKEPTARFAHGMKIIPTREDELAGRIRELGIDVVRAYGGYWACDFATAAKVPGVPVVVSVHDTKEELLHPSVRNADHIFVTSEPVRELVQSRTGSAVPVLDLPNRVDFETFHPCHDEAFCETFQKRFPGRWRIVHVGRKAPQKNPDTLIRALSLLGPDYAAVFIGPGRAEPYEKLSQEVGVARQCHFLPAMPNGELFQFYSHADCVCMASRWEGFGIVFAEALASGAALVSSNIRPINQIVAHNETGILVDAYEDPQALAAAIRNVCENPSLNQRLRAAARPSVERFRRETIDQLEAGHYRHVLAAAKAVPSPAAPGDTRPAPTAAPVIRAREKSRKDWPLHPVYQRLKERLRASRTIVDLGCGNNPVAGATAAVDLYVAPEQRSLGHGATIDLGKFARRGIRFVNARVDGPLPFQDKEFDFAYSHHVFEHLEDPAAACREMVRIARAGAIITPSPFAELAFGRPYHLWLVTDRAGKLVFLSKRKDEDRPFGNHPSFAPGRGWFAGPDTNPFDIALNYGDWNEDVDGPRFEQLGQRLRELWHTHSPAIETIFLWEDSFECLVIDER